MQRSCTYCQEHRLSFSIRAPVQSLITANHRRILTHILSLFFYVEDLSLPVVNGIFTQILLIDNLCLTTRTQPLLVNLKALNFRQWIQSGFSNTLKINYSYHHFQISHVYTIFLSCNSTSQQLLRCKSMRKSWRHDFGKKTSENRHHSLVILDNFEEHSQHIL